MKLAGLFDFQNTVIAVYREGNVLVVRTRSAAEGYFLPLGLRLPINLLYHRFHTSHAGGSNQTHTEPDRELRLSDQIALQNRLIVSIGPTAESHIRRSGFVRTCRRKLQ